MRGNEVGRGRGERVKMGVREEKKRESEGDRLV